LSERPEIWEAYAAFLRRSPELILEWSDPESEARGWLVLNSLRGGAAGGGTRMRPGLTRDEVIFLAKVMECKFSISGPPIGGAKSGIDFDPLDPRKREVLSRWFRAIEPLLAARYGTGGDLNVDVREVVAHCKELGLGHPQEGVVRGHLGLRGADLERRLDTMRDGLATLVEGGIGVEGKHYRVVDLVTGYGVAVATRHLLELQGRSIEGARILVEGFGCVGGSAALYLSRWGASLLGIVDLRSGVVNESGIPQEEVERLLRRQTGNELPVAPGPQAAAAREAFWETPADVLVSAAASGTLTAQRLNALRSIGVHSIISGSNHPFWASEPGDTQLEEIADDEFAIGADFIANSGVASAFASLMLSEETMTADAIFDRVRETIVQALEEAAVRAGGVQRGLLAGGIQLVLERSGVMGPMVRADVGT
jgi:glutamate dehydrogenase/leucine dehydrogenase